MTVHRVDDGVCFVCERDPASGPCAKPESSIEKAIRMDRTVAGLRAGEPSAGRVAEDVADDREIVIISRRLEPKIVLCDADGRALPNETT